LIPRSYGFHRRRLDRPIFLDKVLGVEFGHAAVRSILAILVAPTARPRRGVMHISQSGPSEGLDPEYRGRTGITFTREGKRAILTSWIEPRVSKNSAT